VRVRTNLPDVELFNFNVGKIGVDVGIHEKHIKKEQMHIAIPPYFLRKL